ncbi:betaine--homocysteine S-methyltransferase 1-like isoform X2 [Watersipora subatra]|uniref:betaine--homocysteine S-methyltransferase 1-like isoform X2 n=1 Tax=Watersipora subatra TaxID=2589382 RepID=UPI00355C84AF
MGSIPKGGLLKRLNAKEPIICAEGYLMELDRRGYNTNGIFIPKAVLDNPGKVEDLTKEFVHAGADACSAFVYYSTRNKLRAAEQGDNFELLNRRAHEIAKKVAKETGTLFTSGLTKTGLYDPDDTDSEVLVEQEYREQMAISAELEVDFIQIQTLWDYGEASVALKIAKEYNLPAVITLAPAGPGPMPKTFDGYELKDALQRLLDEGAACVGLNCSRGPKTMIPIFRELRKDIKGPLACVALGYHTDETAETWYRLRSTETGKMSFPDDIGANYIGNEEAEWYARQLKEIGVEFVGFCCGNSSTLTRTLAMAYGRNPPAAKYASQVAAKKNVVHGFQIDRYKQKLAEFLGTL